MKPEGRREPGEVAVKRRELAAVLDGEGGEVRVGYQTRLHARQRTEL